MIDKILSKINRFYSRKGSEWGSGGIFGLKYYKETLYFTLAFEAEAHFITGEDEIVYTFDKVGSKPVSGGDTYNAIETVDDKIYFGGWVHAPVKFLRKGVISFENKFSHVHEYDVSEGKIKLLWKESIHDLEKWTGEVSEIIYDPVNDRLLLARGDGHVNLGVYCLDRKKGDIKQLLNRPSLKGTLFHDIACFNIGSLTETEAIACLDLLDSRWHVKELGDYSRFSVDSGSVEHPMLASITSAYNRVFVFTKGGVIIYNPYMDDAVFVRLFDFGKSGYGPLRTQILHYGGGILVPFNALTHASITPSNVFEESLNTLVGPSVLVYITPSTARIVASFGSRITGLEILGDKLLIASNTQPNLTGNMPATFFDSGIKTIIPISVNEVLRGGPPITFEISGSSVNNELWGGIPLLGYKEPKLIIYSSKENVLEVKSYSLTLNQAEAYTTKYSITQGRNILDLSSYSGEIVSFRFEKGDAESITRFVLT